MVPSLSMLPEPSNVTLSEPLLSLSSTDWSGPVAAVGGLFGGGGGVGVVTVMVTLSVPWSPPSSVTTRVIVCVPTARSTLGLTPVAISEPPSCQE